MQRSRFTTALAGTALALTLAPGAAGAADPPVTLQFAVADGEGRPSDPWVRAFADEVTARSGGTVTVDITWDAGSATEQGFERGVAHLVADGTFDLGLAAGRAWDDVGITALQALQAPFLIDSDPLAEVVATSGAADELLAAMASAGVVGLSLWPEDLRHPVAFEPCIGPIVSPEDLRGRTVRAIPAAVTTDLLETLGATHTWVDGYEDLVATCEIQAAESGLRQGASLPGRPTFTGDVTFFPKYQVLAGATGAFDALTKAQQQAVRDAAIAVRDRAIAEHPQDEEAGRAWCEEGGRVVLAGADAVTAFQEAAHPVIERLTVDPVIAEVIGAIEALKDQTPAAGRAAACEPAAQPTQAPVDASAPLAVLMPDGEYRAEHTVENLMAAGMEEPLARLWAGPKTLSITGTRIEWTDRTGVCAATQSVQFSEVLIRWGGGSGNACSGTDRIRWRTEGDALLMEDLQSTPDASLAPLFSAAPWVRID